MNTAVILTILILSSVGFVQILQYLWRVFVSPAHGVECYNILTIEGHIENIEQLLRWFESSACRDSFFRSRQLIVLDLGADEDTLTTCKCFISVHEGMELYTVDELSENLKHTNVCKSFRYVL